MTRGKGGRRAGHKHGENQTRGDRRDFTLGGEHTKRYTDELVYNCTLGTHVIVLTDVTLIHLKKS